MNKITITAALLASLAIGANRLTAEERPAETPAEHRETLRQYALRNKGDAAHGAKMLAGTLACASCHDFRGHDDTIGGPSLSDVGDRLNREQIIQQILDPSSRSRLIQIRRGEDDPGTTFRLVKDDARTLTVRDPESNATHTLTKSELAGFKFIPSPMPEGQADGLTPEEFADLIAFLVARKKT